MTLSIKKLHSLLNDKGLLPTRHYIIHQTYFMIETISIKNGEGMLVWIPEKYKIPYDNSLKPQYPHYKIKNIKLEGDGDVVSRYADKIDNQKYYPDVDIDTTNIDGTERDIEKLLKENYEHPLTLNGEGNNLDRVKCIYQQLDRLKHCIKYISYGLTVMSGMYFCMTNERNEIDSYIIKNCEDDTPNKKLYVILSLENLITADHPFEQDVKNIHDGIQKILDKNQNIHINKFIQFMNRKGDVMDGLSKLDTFKIRSNDLIHRYEKVLQEFTRKENELIDRYDLIRNGKISDELAKSQLKEEISKISEKKDKTREKVLELQDYMSDLTLKVDQILFDNIVLLKTIHSNIDKFQKIFLD